MTIAGTGSFKHNDNPGPGSHNYKVKYDAPTMILGKDIRKAK